METMNSNENWYLYNIIEGIGMDHSLFPFDQAMVGTLCVEGPLRCYSEDGVQLIEWGYGECDYEVMDVKEADDVQTVTMNTLVEDVLRMVFPKTQESTKQICIVDLTGKTICAQSTTDKTIEIDFTNKPKGMYIAQITTNFKTIYIKFIRK